MENVVGLSGLGAAAEVDIGASSARVALPANARAISIVAVGASASFKLGDSTVTAAATDHHIVSGTRMDVLVRDGQTHIAAIHDPNGTGKLRISALVNAYTVANERENANYGDPVNVVAPVVTGGTNPGDVLTCAPGTWRGSPPITFKYQWYSNGVAIPGATSVSYNGTVGSRSYECAVSASNAHGTASEVRSNSISVSEF